MARKMEGQRRSGDRFGQPPRRARLGDLSRMGAPLAYNSLGRGHLAHARRALDDRTGMGDFARWAGCVLARLSRPLLVCTQFMPVDPHTALVPARPPAPLGIGNGAGSSSSSRAHTLFTLASILWIAWNPRWAELERQRAEAVATGVGAGAGAGAGSDVPADAVRGRIVLRGRGRYLVRAVPAVG